MGKNIEKGGGDQRGRGKWKAAMRNGEGKREEG